MRFQRMFLWSCACLMAVAGYSAAAAERAERFPAAPGTQTAAATPATQTTAQNPPAAASSETAQTPPAAHAFPKNTVVYVSDFELDAENVQVDSSAGNRVRPGILERPRKREQQDPQAQATKLVDLMSTTLVKDLTKAGYKAQRLMTGEPMPTSGAWVHGVFTEVNEGNRLQRAIIGFGAGQSSMSLYVTVTDLASPQTPLYSAAEQGASRKAPGAVITMNPYAAAAKFVMEKNAPDKMVKKTAGDIATEVEGQLKGQPPPPAPPAT